MSMKTIILNKIDLTFINEQIKCLTFIQADIILEDMRT